MRDTVRPGAAGYATGSGEQDVIGSGRRFALMNGDEYFAMERAISGDLEWSLDLAKAFLYPTERDAFHDLRVVQKRIRKANLKVVEV